MVKTGRKMQLIGGAMLLVTALIWGASFVAQSEGMKSVSAFTYNGIRTVIGALVLLPAVLIRDGVESKKKPEIGEKEKKAANRKVLLYGTILGAVFCIASNLQQFAFSYDNSPGKIAFITAMYMFVVPVIGIVLKKKTPWLTWVCVAAGVAGLYLLCVKEGGLGTVSPGDLLALGCAVFFAFHILLIERFSPETDGLKLSCMQFAVSGVLSCILMFIFEKPELSSIMKAAIPILYSGVLSCGIAYTLQIIGQRYTEATVASLLMSMESVFAVLAQAVLLGMMLAPREALGCAIMFVAITVAQLTGVITDAVRRKRQRTR